MGGDRPFNTRALVAWEPGELAILIPLRHDLITVDLSTADRQWTTEPIRA